VVIQGIHYQKCTSLISERISTNWYYMTQDIRGEKIHTCSFIIFFLVHNWYTCLVEDYRLYDVWSTRGGEVFALKKLLCNIFGISLLRKNVLLFENNFIIFKRSTFSAFGFWQNFVYCKNYIYLFFSLVEAIKKSRLNSRLKCNYFMTKNPNMKMSFICVS